ncbi:uncharacterized protein CC84DRAFT_1207357 [Paraphaeosphaeria sporulosa]|uniref:Uncharacterized protein n=1 Tax=Paraphaeosphaeria sporulosa TaxID=1460663 RepID=A0A177C967_9PLEO|nr:uncharacterized protein CC84DRAFT_1207357 [Paraphaeosphaeria sporulosa]OAG04193.1 hypothetical protein CC84DRAFT_1207357 [Paraphaeosphaeria sporulosa]
MPTNYNTGYWNPEWDPIGKPEPRDTTFTLTVYTPPRPPPKYLPAFLTREPLDTKPFHVIRAKSPTPDYTHFERRDLSDMPTKIVKTKAYRVPAALRCKHLRESTVCNEGCYVLEKGGKEVRRFRCLREECEGHVYCGNVKEDDEGVKCFGKKGERLVCIEGLP